jgi:hypothetical protein
MDFASNYRSTLSGIYSYDSIYLNIPAVEFINELNLSDENPKARVREKTYTYDIYNTIVCAVCDLYLSNKEDMTLYIRGQLDSEKYEKKIHEELINLYLAYKNTSDDEKTAKGFYLKDVTNDTRNDVYTTYIENLDEMFTQIYTKYIDIVLKKITEAILLNGISNM